VAPTPPGPPPVVAIVITFAEPVKVIPVPAARVTPPVNPFKRLTYAVIPGLYESHADPFHTHVRPANVYWSFTAGFEGKFKGIG
jgi:hypothetical protein